MTAGVLAAINRACPDLKPTRAPMHYPGNFSDDFDYSN
jgi:hypothetical protein